VPTYANDALGALTFPAPFALATFSAELQCRLANEDFARLVERTVADVTGRPWLELFPTTLGRDMVILRAILAGTATGVVVDLPGIPPQRRHGEDPRGRPSGHRAIAYRIEDATAPLLGLISSRPARRYASWNDLRGIETTNIATVRRRIWMLKSSDTVRDRTLVLAADIGAPTMDPEGSFRPAIDLLGLASNLMANFRADDSLTLLSQRWPILACTINSEADAGLLCDRFRMTIQRWRDTSTSPWRPLEVRMSVGSCTASPVDLLARLDAPADWDKTPRPTASFAPAFLRAPSRDVTERRGKALRSGGGPP
jgi:hypothetical protein